MIAATELSRTSLELEDELRPALGGKPTVIGEIMSDGSVRILDRPEDPLTPSAWSEGSVSGKSWTLWWQRRSWGNA